MNFSQWTDPVFWNQLAQRIESFGIFAPIFLAMLESIIPALPLVIIVILNVNIYGLGVGFLTSYVGTMLGATIMFLFYRTISFYGLHEKLHKFKAIDKTINWVNNQRPIVIIVLSMLPSTPSSFMNLAFGLAQYSKRKYLISIAIGKVFMIALFAFFGNAFQAKENQIWIYLGSALLFIVTYFISKSINKRTGINEVSSR
jgi:uncharacterized membrane protein YdjX (TVP38/TMEM64 family)